MDENLSDCENEQLSHDPRDADEFGHGLGELEVVDDEIDHDDQAELM